MWLRVTDPVECRGVQGDGDPEGDTHFWSGGTTRRRKPAWEAAASRFSQPITGISVSWATAAAEPVGWRGWKG